VHTVSEGHRKPKTGRCIKALIPSKELWLANDEMTHAWKEKLFFFFSLERKTVCLLCYEKRQVAPSLISGALSLRQERVTGQERASFLQNTRASPPNSDTVTYRHFLPTTH
jgi:hypothetical protein